MTPSLTTPGLASRLDPFLAAGILGLGEAHVVDRIGIIGQEARVDVLLGLALAVRAPRVGHTGIDLCQVHTEVGSELTPSVPLPWPADLASWRADVLASPLVGQTERDRCPFACLENLLQTNRMADLESRLARALCQRAGLLPGAIVDRDRLIADLSETFPGVSREDPQILAATLGVLSRTTMISGGPGTGKTTTVRRLLQLLYGQAVAGSGRPPRVALAAPTGKAAARMREALLGGREELPPAVAAWVATLHAVTLHRLLGFLPASPSRFLHNRSNPLPFDVVVVDEASMIDVAMMCKLVEAVFPDARLVLLGDKNQLASVEAGSVLADLAAVVGARGIRLPAETAGAVADVLGPSAVEQRSDVAAPALCSGMVHYTKAFRFDVEELRVPIYALAAASNEPAMAAEHVAVALAGLLDCPSEAVRHFDHEEGELSPAVLREIARDYALAIEPLQQRPLDPGCQERSLKAIDGLRVLTAYRAGVLGVRKLNEAIVRSVRGEGGTWWTGRLVMVTENDAEHQLWNGDVGLALPLNDGWGVVFPGSELPRVVPAGSLPAHETAFALTIHKSQGSQFRHCVLVLPEIGGPLLTRELIYTGISRASHRLTLCGSEAVLRAAVARCVTRASGLAQRLDRAAAEARCE